MKNIKFISILILVLSLLASFAACTQPEEDEVITPPPGEELLEGDLIISDAEATVTLGDVFTPKVMIGEEVLVCSWTSKNPAIASVEGNGRITANNVGETTVTATYGDRSIECKITVDLNNNIPALVLDSVDGDSAQIDMLHALSLGGSVIFNGKEYNDVVLSYTLSDDSFGSINDGIFKPSKLGEGTVTVSAEWRGISSYLLTKTVNIKVVETAVILINDSPSVSDVKLYTVSELAGISYNSTAPFVAKVSHDGELYDAAVSVSDTDVVMYDADTKSLVAVGAGSTSVSIAYNSGSVSLVQSVNVNVTSPVMKYDKKIVNFSALDGDLVDTDGKDILATYFSGDNELYSATEGGRALDISTGKVLGVGTETDGLTKTTVTVIGKKYGLVFDVEGYTKVLDDAADFNVFDFTNTGKTLKGYFKVIKDIDFLADSEGFSPCNTAGWDGALSSSWFEGIFDGAGHTINGYPLADRASIFGRVEGGTIKDVAFTNIQVNDGSRVFGHMIGMSKTVTISNVYVSIGSFNRSENFSIFGDRELINLVLQDVVIEMKSVSEKLVTANNGVGLFRNNTNGNTAKYNNVVLIAPPAENGRVMPVCQFSSTTIYAKNDYDSFGLGSGSAFAFDETTKNPTAGASSNTFAYCDVNRYDSIADLKEAGVNAVGGWDLSTGEPVWTTND